MKSIITSIGAIVFVAAVVIGGTGAFFSDTETSQANTFTAGAIDLTVDSEAHYNGSICLPNLVTTGDLTDYTWQGGTEYPVGLPCSGSWEATDLENGVHKFFNFADVKPGDEGENTISLHVDNNDAYACVDVTITSNDDVSCNDPEVEAEGANMCENSLPSAEFDGELAENLEFFAWVDDGSVDGFGDEEDEGEGDNIWQAGELPLFSNGVGSASDVLDGESYTLADSNTGPLTGGVTHYIGLQWCAGDLTIVGPGSLDCDGAAMGNDAQTDEMIADIAFRVEQARNNENFVCSRDDDDDDGGGLGCNEKADVMFVLDSSGSIDAVELALVKDAAISFADALNPSDVGNHIGVVDFDTSATLRSHLTDVELDIQNAINLLTSGGNTNLGAGITTASTELANPGDGHDRVDVDSPDYIVVITDGNPQDAAAATAAANAAKGAGTTIYVVGIGDELNEAYLETIASDPSLYFNSEEFDDLEAILNNIADCELPITPAQ